MSSIAASPMTAGVFRSAGSTPDRWAGPADGSAITAHGFVPMYFLRLRADANDTMF